MLLTDSFSDVSLEDYLDNLRLSPGYAGTRRFISRTTWLPSISGGFFVGDSKLQNPMQISVVGQISQSESSLNPFEKMPTWTLPKDFDHHVCSFNLTNPVLFGSNFQKDFNQSLKNIRLLSESITFPSFDRQNHTESCVHVDKLYNNCLVLHFPFFHKLVYVISNRRAFCSFSDNISIQNVATPTATLSDGLDDLIIASNDHRLTSLVWDIYETHEFNKIPVYSMAGSRILPIQLPGIAGALVKLNFLAGAPCTFSRKIDFQSVSFHVIKSHP